MNLSWTHFLIFIWNLNKSVQWLTWSPSTPSLTSVLPATSWTAKRGNAASTRISWCTPSSQKWLRHQTSLTVNDNWSVELRRSVMIELLSMARQANNYVAEGFSLTTRGAASTSSRWGCWYFPLGCYFFMQGISGAAVLDAFCSGFGTVKKIPDLDFVKIARKLCILYASTINKSIFHDNLTSLQAKAQQWNAVCQPRPQPRPLPQTVFSSCLPARPPAALSHCRYPSSASETEERENLTFMKESKKCTIQRIR